MRSAFTKGRLITFEGLDGTGKSTQIELLAAALGKRGIDILLTREPGGTTLGEEIRRILLDPRRREISPYAELALMFACRAQLLDEVIVPALHCGRWVLCDRFTDSSEAYQGAGRGLGSAPVHSLHRTLARNCAPWMTIYLDAPLEKSLQRARARNASSHAKNEGRFEAESSQFFMRVQHGFREIARRDSNRVVTVNADQSIDAIHRQILVHLDSKIREEEGAADELQGDSPNHVAAARQLLN
jgi:dTMP kinase